MQITYRSLFEVKVLHDYFLLPGAVPRYPDGFDLRRLIHITPDEATASLMRRQHMLFMATATGFKVMVQAEDLTGTGTYATVADVDASLKLSFHWTLLDPLFENYTNRRILEKNKAVYYFSNRDGAVAGSTAYLNSAVVPFGTTYDNETVYRLGDMVIQAGETYELIEQEAPPVNFPANAAKWQKINTAVINYVHPAARIPLQGPRFVYARPNTGAGELITASLFDADNRLIDLGMIPGTTQPQSEYRTSSDGTQPVNFVMDLSRLTPGLYRMDIQESTGMVSRKFYYIHPAEKPDLFGVTTCFLSGAAAPFTFLQEDPVSKRWLPDNPGKIFTIRFRNRLTRWKYLKQDQTVFNEPPAPRPLTQVYSGYNIPGPAGSTIQLPDPSPHTIVPDLDPVTHQVKNIYSKIYLVK